MSDYHRGPANSEPSAAILEGPAALVIGHPGHELRIHHWLETSRPLTFVLTDGSGRGLKSRLPSTRRVLEQAGAKPGPIFGPWTDAETYQFFLSNNLTMICGITRELATGLQQNEIQIVVADAEEGFNPSHDLCRYMTNAAVLLAERETGRKIANFDFVLEAPPDFVPPESGHPCVRIQLDGAALARKRLAAENYPELKAEVEAAIARFGLEIFATELLRAVVAECPADFEGQTFYETHGADRVNQGLYEKVIRRRQHVLPLIQALWRKLDLPV